MKTEQKFRLPVFEAAALAVILVIGWAVWQLHHVARQEAEDTATASDLDAYKLRDEYQKLAHDLRQQITAVHTPLTNYLELNASDTRRTSEQREQSETALREFKENSQRLEQWLEGIKEHAAAEQLAQKSQSLKERIARQGLTADDDPVSMTSNFGALLGEMDHAWPQYLESAQYLVKNIGAPVIGRRIEQHLRLANRHRIQLLNIGRQARAEHVAIDRFLAVSEPVVVEKKRAFWSPAIYGWLLAIIALLQLLLIALYRRKIVSPIRAKLRESIEHQNKLLNFSYLASELAHEVKNPLTAINARLYTLKKKLKAASPEDTDAAVIGKEIARLDQTVNNFLKQARSPEPKFVLTKAEPALSEVRDLFAPQFESQAIELKCEAAVETPFRADPQQLKQVLINLIQNAAESIGHDGAITLRARAGKARLNGHPADVVMLEVEDTGPGIPPEVQKRLFDPLFTTKDGGSGLGLVIASRIVEQHKGSLEFETEPGHGTTFRVVLPVADGE